MQGRRAAGLGLLLGLAVGLAAGVAWSPSDPAPSPEPAPPDAAAAAVPAELLAERARLAQEIARLEREREDLLQALAERDATAASEQAPAADAQADAEAEALASRLAALAAAGWLPAEIARLREAFDAYQLERLYLRDQATREGWRDGARFRREQRALLDELRAELGDPDYDAALYAEGRQNRAEVISLLEGSPAQASGLRPGDEILSYAGERIFDPIRLVRLTVAGEAGLPVELRVLRGGEEIRVFVPRGPLGVRLRPVSRPPFGLR